MNLATVDRRKHPEGNPREQGTDGSICTYISLSLLGCLFGNNDILVCDKRKNIMSHVVGGPCNLWAGVLDSIGIALALEFSNA